MQTQLASKGNNLLTMPADDLQYQKIFIEQEAVATQRHDRRAVGPRRAGRWLQRG
jgi:hypothetical protein